ncbi:hypothetical protein GPECTOR_102g61 [Gonium pectorale]|uniref:Uncharacterized protein n=1 Tax=Gonium pectorale TaxID=33097 RepID=A0A150FZV5_GONPE|nr:hypothetical protein GPECTOR_102g61 [Gonium pectorale]|eukprot:KXZ43108.1 hypothetical protein GPECTOR_102g61 [Gonium pectorale]
MLPGASPAPEPPEPSNRAASGGVLQSAMKIPGLASALHLIGVGGHDSSASANAAGTASATGNSRQGSVPDDPADSVYELAAAATAASNGNGKAPLHGSHAPLIGHANGHSVAGGAASTTGTAEEILLITDPAARIENNITPYNAAAGPASLATQIREIATTLRSINALRLEYLDKIAQQELEIATKDRALRSKEERIAALEAEMGELRRSMALMHNTQVATEVGAAAPRGRGGARGGRGIR